MDHYKETASTWNKLADLYEERFMDFTIYNESYDFVCDTLSEDQTSVLEVGCGPGIITRYLLGKRPDLNILGTDVAPNMIALAQKNNPNARFEVLDCREIISLHQTFDAVLSGFCIPYLSPEDVKKFISNSSQILHPNGLLYLSFVPGTANQSGYQTGSSGDRVYFHYHPEEDILHVLEENNFGLIKRFAIDYEKSNGEKEEHLVILARRNQ